MKIKGWKKIKEGIFETKEQKREPTIVGYRYPKTRLEYSHFKNLHWITIMKLSKNKTFFSPYFKTKKQALKFAREYMKKHPNG